MAAIDLDGVVKDYGGFEALSGLDLEVHEGEIYGFLGPNGAGKSTTINLILDFIHPTDGRIEVLGHDAQTESLAIRQRTGVLPEGFDLYDRLTGRQHLAFASRSKNADEDLDELAARVGLPEDIDRKVGGYSKGMKQRLALGAALVGQPDLLILDEPSSGLDPGGAREMREIAREEADRGATVFFSSHVLEQVEAVCDRVGILRDGELVAENTLEGLRDAAGTENLLTMTVERVPQAGVDAVRDLPGVSEVTTDETTISVRCEDDAKADVIVELDATGAEIRDFDLEEASLEELFVSYTSRGSATDGATNGAGGLGNASSDSAADSTETEATAEGDAIEAEGRR